MLYVQLKANVVSGAFISFGFLGEAVVGKNDEIILKEAATVFEVPYQDENRNTVVRLQVSMNSQVSNSPITVNKADVLFYREVDSTDELIALRDRSREILLSQKEDLKNQLANN